MIYNSLTVKTPSQNLKHSIFSSCDDSIVNQIRSGLSCESSRATIYIIDQALFLSTNDTKRV